jgi:hypothetical protein
MPASRLLAISLAATVLALSLGGATQPRERLCPLQGVQQLRIYEIFEGNKAAFHARFRDHAQRIMKRHGFDIIAFWESGHGGRTEFVYLLQWPDEATMKRRWASFMADEEWSRIKRETSAAHGQLVGDIEERVLGRTDYSPC